MKKIIAIAAAGLMLAGCATTTDSTTSTPDISGEEMVMVSFKMAKESMPASIEAICQTVDMYGMDFAFDSFNAGWKTTNPIKITQSDFEPAIRKYC